MFEQKFALSLVFFVHIRHFDVDFLFLLFYIYFFKYGFPNSLLVRSRSSFLLSQ